LPEVSLLKRPTVKRWIETGGQNGTCPEVG
jgi:hypothetical protein